MGGSRQDDSQRSPPVFYSLAELLATSKTISTCEILEKENALPGFNCIAHKVLRISFSEQEESHPILSNKPLLFNNVCYLYLIPKV